VSLTVRREGSLGARESGPSAGRSHGNGVGTAAGTAPIAAPATPKLWATVSFHENAPAPEAGLERFAIEAVEVVRGPRPTEWWPGMAASRRELLGVHAPDAISGGWSGIVEPAHSSPPELSAELRGAWQANPFRVVLVIACKHVARFWELGRGERQFDHCGLPDNAAAQRSPILRKVVRQLQRAVPDGSSKLGWDTLAQFEMLPEHVAHLREHLAERRELAAHADLVEREVELWMVKHRDHG
jgi:hypothetical protein